MDPNESSYAAYMQGLKAIDNSLKSDKAYRDYKWQSSLIKSGLILDKMSKQKNKKSGTATFRAIHALNRL